MRRRGGARSSAYAALRSAGTSRPHPPAAMPLPVQEEILAHIVSFLLVRGKLGARSATIHSSWIDSAAQGVRPWTVTP